MQIQEDLDQLISILPPSVQSTIQGHPQKQILVEIIMDLGRRPEARFPTHVDYLSPKLVTWQDLDYSVKRLSQFTDDNRAGIEKTLHRISCVKNRQGLVIGLTCRVGRAIYGTINIIRDLLESKKSILVLGRPGVGKTTMIREIARVIANEMDKRVVIIDTSNEIAGDSDIPHVGIGRARRMHVSHTNLQHNVMIEAVENHMPEVVIIDEIGTELEALAAQTIAERGVQLIGTAHGTFLGSLIKNPTLSDLVGGIHCVTLSDEEARRRGSQKTILERKGLPVFQIAIELNGRNFLTIHEQVENSIDLLLQDLQPKLQVRIMESKFLKKFLLTKVTSNERLSAIKLTLTKKSRTKICDLSIFSDDEIHCRLVERAKIRAEIPMEKFYIYVYSVPPLKFMNLAKKSFNFNLIITNQFQQANYIIGLESHLKNNRQILEFAFNNRINILYLYNNNNLEINRTLQELQDRIMLNSIL
jgi:stage III sporulation protein SpoIIIAA